MIIISKENLRGSAGKERGTAQLSVVTMPREECQLKHGSEFIAASDLEAKGWERKWGSHSFLFIAPSRSTACGDLSGPPSVLLLSLKLSCQPVTPCRFTLSCSSLWSQRPAGPPPPPPIPEPMSETRGS